MAKGVNSDTKREVYSNSKKPSMSNKKPGLAKYGVTQWPPGNGKYLVAWGCVSSAALKVSWTLLSEIPFA